MKKISIPIPEKALKLVNKWADARGIPRDKFYSESLIMGARIMAISAPPDALADIPSKDFEYLSESANSGVTQKAILQIIIGSKSRTLLDDSEQPLNEIVVSLPDEQFKQFSDHAGTIGMQHEKYFSLAFAIGVRLYRINNSWKR